MGFYAGMKVAVIGGAGMIGSHLVELLEGEGADVTVLDNLSRGRKQNLSETRCQFIYTDASVLTNLNALKGMNAVFNLAAKVTGMHYNRKHHAEMFYENIMLQTVPLRACIMWEVPLYLQSSTVCVYPHDMAYPVYEEEGHRGEPEPTNAGYGWAKRMGERYAQWVAQEYDIKIGITRLSNAFGPRDYFDEETSHVIPALIRRTIEDDYVMVYGTGLQSREFLYAKDAAMGMMKVLEHYPRGYPVNIGSPANRITIEDLADLIQEIVGVKKPLYFDASIPDGYPRRGSRIDKLVAKAGWQPQTTLREGLRATVAWYLDMGG